MKNTKPLPFYVIAPIPGGPNCMAVGRCFRDAYGSILISPLDLDETGPQRNIDLQIDWFLREEDVTEKLSFNTKQEALDAWLAFKL